MADEGRAKVNSDPVLGAIDHLLSVLEQISRDRVAIAQRAELIRIRREAGVPYAVIVPDESPPLIVERTRHSLNELVRAAGRLQRAEARALYAEGLSMDRIASLFGISRQRVADLVKNATEEVS
jgi:DNA invertase Pin-like site-specific DNA recombinase